MSQNWAAKQYAGSVSTSCPIYISPLCCVMHVCSHSKTLKGRTVYILKAFRSWIHHITGSKDPFMFGKSSFFFACFRKLEGFIISREMKGTGLAHSHLSLERESTPPLLTSFLSGYLGNKLFFLPLKVALKLNTEANKISAQFVKHVLMPLEAPWHCHSAVVVFITFKYIVGIFWAHSTSSECITRWQKFMRWMAYLAKTSKWENSLLRVTLAESFEEIAIDERLWQI